MVRRVGVGEVGKAAAGPVEVAAVHDRAADGGAVAAQEFGGAVGDDVGAPLERPTKVGCGEGVVDHQRDAVRPGNRRDLLEGEDSDVRVTQRLAVDDLGVGPDGLLEAGRVVRLHERDVDPQAREGVRELIVGATVEPAAGDDVISRPA